MEAAHLVTKLGFETETKPLEALEEKLELIRHRLEFLGAVEVVKGLYELAERFAGMGEQLETAAISAGVTTEAFQKLAYAASQNSVGQEELSGALAHLNRQLYQAQQGGAEATKAFADAGISRAQIAGYRNSGDALKGLADRFAAISDPVKKQALAQELLGRGSYKMVKLLNQGGAGIKAFGDEAEKMGAVVDEKAIAKLAMLEDTMSGFFGLIKSFAANVAAAFAPAIITLVHSFEHLYAANRTVIMQTMKEWMHNTVYAVVYVGTWIKLLTQDFFEFARAHPLLLEWGLKLVTGLGAASIAFAGVAKVLSFVKGVVGDVKGVIEMLLVPMKAVGKAGLKMAEWVWKGLGWIQGALVWILERLALLVVETFPALGEALLAFSEALAATPVGVFAAAIAAAVVAAHDLWVMFVEGKSWRDTWVGQMLLKLEAAFPMLRKAFEWISGGAASAPAADAADGKPGKPGADGMPAAEESGGMMARMRSFFGGDGSKAAGQAQQGMQTLAAAAAPPATLAVAGVPKALDPSAAQSTSITVNAPVTVNVPAGTSPKSVHAAVQDGVRDHLNEQNRVAQRRVQTARVY